MASSRVLISSQTLASSASSVTFSSIPDTYTDLILRYSARTDDTNANDNTVLFRINNNSSKIYSMVMMRGNGATAIASQNTDQTSINTAVNINGSSATSTTFSTVELTIPNYVSSIFKTIQIDNAQENNATTAYRISSSALVGLTDAVTSISLTSSVNFIAGSSFALYGVSRIGASTAPSTPTSISASAGGTGTTNATISFTPSGSASDSYKITSSPGSIVSYGKYSPVTISGLTRGTSYSFTVSAVNDKGASTTSSASNSVTPATYTNWFGGYFDRTLSSCMVNTVIPDSSGNHYISGYSGGAYVAKLNSYGDVIWQNTTDTTNTNGSVCNIDSSGNVYHLLGSANNTQTLIKYNSSGAILWQRQLSSTIGSVYMGGNAYGAKLAVDSSNNIYICGFFGLEGDGGYNGWVVKYNSSGTLQWQRRVSDGNSSYYRRVVLKSLEVDSSGNVYLGGDGSVNSNSFAIRALIIKYNSSGTLQWQRTLSDGNAASSQNTEVIAITCDSSGNSYATGNTKNTSGGTDLFLAKYDTSGTLQWQRKFYADAGAAANGNSFSIGIDSSSNLYLAPNVASTMCLLKYNSSGTLQWQRTVGNPSQASGIWGNGVYADNTNSKVMFGRGFNKVGGYAIGLVGKVPMDGTGTGTYTLPLDNNSVAYATTTAITDAAGGLTGATGSYTDATGVLTDAAGSVTIKSDTFNNFTYEIVGF